MLLVGNGCEWALNLTTDPDGFKARRQDDSWVVSIGHP